MKSHYSRIVLHEPGQISLEQFNLSDLQIGWECVRPIYTGLCGSDLALFFGRHPFRRFPVYPGHECVVLSESGDMFILNPLVTCGKCVHCLNNKPYNCLEKRVIGFGYAGGLSEVMAVPSSNLLHLPQGLDPQKAVLAEPLAVVLSTFRLISSNPEHWRILIYGGGPIAIMAAVIARTRNYEVMMVEPGRRRAVLAQQLGIKEFYDPADDKTTEITKKFLERGGCCIDVTGSSESLEWLLKVSEPEGNIFILGTIGRETRVKPWKIADKGLMLRGSVMYLPEDIHVSATLLQKELGFIDQIVTHQIDLAQLPDFVQNITSVPLLGKVVTRIMEI
jgi:threonine dehydrogenase-like Zn-dependent dehydrogenase